MARHRRRKPVWEIRSDTPDGTLELWRNGRIVEYGLADVDEALSRIPTRDGANEGIVYHHPDGYIQQLDSK